MTSNLACLMAGDHGGLLDFLTFLSAFSIAFVMSLSMLFAASRISVVLVIFIALEILFLMPYFVQYF